MFPRTAPGVADASALLGGLAWAGFALADGLGPVREILALAVLVLVPLCLRLVDTPRRDGSRTRWYRTAVVGQPVTAVPAVASLTLPPGPVATALAVPWAALTAVVACFGLWRFAQRGPWPLAELAIDAGLVYVAVGGGALLFDRAGLSLVFQPVIVTLTAVHFHYAGLVLPVTAGLAGRAADSVRFRRIRRVTTGIIAVGPGIIATGITAAGLDLPFAGVVEFVSVAFFTSAVALFSLAVLAGVLPGRESRAQRVLVGVASLAVTVSMSFAVCYGLARATGGTYFGIHADSFGRMVRYHGQLNAFGFGLLALVGWRLAPSSSSARSPGIPFSRLAAAGRVGEDFLDRTGYATDDEASGMVARVTDYAWDGFDPDAVDPAVARFYERSGEYLLAVDPNWASPWGRLVPLYRAVAGRYEQLTLPLTTVDDESVLRGRVFGVDGPDATAGTRAWVRSNTHVAEGSARMTYVATYGSYEADGTTFLRATFPLPRANLTGILRVENVGPESERLRLASNAAAGNADDAGLYLVVRGFGVRLPLDETLVVASADDGSGDDGSGDDDNRDEGGVTATHEIRALGRRLVTLEYDVTLAPAHADRSERVPRET